MVDRIVIVLSLVVAAAAQNTIPDSGLTFELEGVATIPDSSTGNIAPPRISLVTQDPAGRLFASDQRGVLYRFEEGTGTVTEYLDLRDDPNITVESTNEAGFHSFAFHPDFQQAGANGFGCLYTIHSCKDTATPDFDTAGSANFDTLLLEWKTDDPSAGTFVPSTPATPYRQVLRLNQPFGNHNAGLIAFNPTVLPGDSDYGMLRISIGDGGSGGDPQNNAQTADNPFGAILRIDPLGSNATNGEYGIPADNVFAADGDSGTLAENFCIGLRNPQRFGWDLVTGQAFIADIGQGTFEEVNLMGNGVNFGWNVEEGSGGAPTYTDPVAGYFHNTSFANVAGSTVSKAVTCGEVMRGTCIGGFEGVLPVADFPNGRVFRLNVDTDPLDGGIDGLSEVRFKDGPAGSRTLFINLINAARSARGLSNVSRTDLRFSMNTPGRLYVSNKHDGIIRRVVPDEEPSIEITAADSLHFNGILQVSDDLSDWTDVIPQPLQGQSFDTTAPRRFFRSVRK